MSATFVHLGDAHLHPGPRQAMRLRALDQIIRENLDRPDLAAWLWPGDLFHQRSTIDDRNALKDRVRLMAGRAPVIMCYGNHDLPGDLDIFGALASAWPITVVSTPKVISVLLATGDVASIFVLPYPTEAGLAGAGVAPGAIVPTARELLEPIFMAAAGKLEAARARGELTLMIGHVNVAGSSTSSGQPNIGQEIEVDEALLSRLGDLYIGLNHIHKAQAIGGAHYAGSICRLDWGEIEPKRYLLAVYDLAGREWRFAGWRSCPLDVPPMYHVEGWLTPEGFDYQVKAGPDGAALEPPTSWRGCEVRVRYRFHQSQRQIIQFARAHLLAEFADSIHPITYEPIAVPDRALRAPAVATATTLEAKLQAWCEVAHVVPPATVAERLAMLEHGDPELVVAGVQRVMDLLTAPAPEREEVVA